MLLLTSGLDSTTALELMLTLKELAQKGGHSIVTVIHQPRTTIFELVDGLLLLSKGEEVYSGPADGARRVLETCPIIGFDLPDQTNIADWIMDVITKDEMRVKLKAGPDQDEESNATTIGRVLPRHWANTRSELESENGSQRIVNRAHRLSSLAEIKNSMPKYTTSFATQLRLLARRQVKQTRGEKISKAALIAIVSYTIFETAFWFRLTNDTNHIYERNSLIFFMIISQANGIVFSAVPTFKKDRDLLTRERAKKMYRVLPYFFAKTFAGEYSSIVIFG